MIHSLVKMLGYVFKCSLFFFSVTLYWTWSDERTPFETVLLKLLPILSLVIFVCLHCLSNGMSKFSTGILLGLVFSGIGDHYLEFPDTYFLEGVASSAVAQLIYGITFGLTPFKLPILLCCTFSGALMYVYIYPDLDSVFAPMIALYVTLINFTLWRALSRFHSKRWTWGQLLCALGALFFVISHFVIGVDKFRHVIHNRHDIVVATYFIAQFGITMAITDYPTEANKRKEI